MASSSALGMADSARMRTTGSFFAELEAGKTAAGAAARSGVDASHRTRRKGASPSRAALQSHACWSSPRNASRRNGYASRAPAEPALEAE